MKSAQNFGAIHFNDMEQMTINSAAMTIGQAAEWVMGAIQGSIPRLLDTFLFEDGPGERLETLQMINAYLQFSMQACWIKSDTNTFVPEQSKDAQYLMY
jgi:hypothetical protein